METQFYKTQDGVLARIRHSGRAVPEVYAPHRNAWSAYPALDTMHDATPIDSAEAGTMCPGADLNASGP